MSNNPSLSPLLVQLDDTPASDEREGNSSANLTRHTNDNMTEQQTPERDYHRTHYSNTNTTTAAVEDGNHNSSKKDKKPRGVVGPNTAKVSPAPAAVVALSNDTKQNNAHEKSNYSPLLSLPLDSMHYVASFLTPIEWKEFGSAGKVTNRVFREVIRRVRLHGFRCATEIVTAWRLGQHADAKELAALYVQAGVPIYPRSLGHSYHTLLWRMGVEIKEKQNASAEQKREEDTEIIVVNWSKPDPFYMDRQEFKLGENYNPDWTYLEEKTEYWVQKKHPVSDANRGTNSRSMAQSSKTNAARKDTNNQKKPQFVMGIHQHLLDQHRLGHGSVNDEDGTMITPPVSLSIDFFHQYNASDTEEPTDGLFQSEKVGTHGDETREDVHTTEARRKFTKAIMDNESSRITDRVDLEIYSSSTIRMKQWDSLGMPQELKTYLESRFSIYQRRLEAFLSKGEHVHFDECVLDFWDDFFPRTAGIHYFDRYTAVPRLSRLEQFLTRPCPKAIGTVQCEIERIRINARGKGVKGRFFPTYEYRLFIRDRPHYISVESADVDEQDFVRRDTLLMVAKNRGRKHMEGLRSSTPAPSKKGSNNYFLYMPQQSDVDAHYCKVNERDESFTMNPNGAGQEPVIVTDSSSSLLLGRLQSNFVGTEFQIFTPRPVQRSSGQDSPHLGSCSQLSSDEDVDYDSGGSSDNNSPSQRSRFGRLSSHRRRTSENGDDNSAESTSPRRSRPVQRATSCPDIAPRPASRPRRKAVADSSSNAQHVPLHYYEEEEDGAITYTANLLGSRPRIMDVCIPRVSLEGVPGVEWRAFVDHCDVPEDCRMLSCFKQLLHRLDNTDPERLHGETESQEVDDCGLLVLQNRPPWWNVELGSFVLNFGGRVSVASVKNFQLCERTDHDKIMLQFGRIQGRHSFTMDFQYPLTAVQAFSIAISSLQSKISFG